MWNLPKRTEFCAVDQGVGILRADLVAAKEIANGIDL